MRSPSIRTIPAPQLPQPAEPHKFPLVATIAPVLGSLVIWAVTSSPFALVFAFLGPVVAISSLVDSRFSGRKRRKRENKRFRDEVILARAAIDECHHSERSARRLQFPAARTIDAAPLHDPERWRRGPSEALFVRLGLGVSESEVRLDGVAARRLATSDQCEIEQRLLEKYASTLTGAPISVDARLGIGICGSAVIAAAVARGIVLQVAAQLSPSVSTVRDSATVTLGWLAELPHGHSDHDSPQPRESDSAGPTETDPAPAPTLSEGTVARGSPVQEVRFSTDAADIVIAIATTLESIAPECRVVLELRSGQAPRVVRAPRAAEPGLSRTHPAPTDLAAVEFTSVEFVSSEQAFLLAHFLSAASRARGLSPMLLQRFGGDFSSLEQPAHANSAAAASSLACVFATSAAGTIEVDLVKDGPHSIVGGTTGSGKSELLLSWVLAMAKSWPPSRVNFLLIDFKGGSAFSPVADLPHVVGIVTDLDNRQASRALVSLRAELRYRERALAEAGARSIDESNGALPRLVIVVDEFAAMASDFPELHELFIDLASRGRSLGMHLILCTQRPTGVIRDSVLANSALRLSLRVNNNADSVAVIGTDDAAKAARGIPGQVWLSRGGNHPQSAIVVQVTAADIERIINRWPNAGTARRPWCDDLPAVVTLEQLFSPDGDAESAEWCIPFALGDFPETQCQTPVVYRPRAEGHLLIVGAQQTGKTTALSTLARTAGALQTPSSIEDSWDTVTACIESIRQGRPACRLLLIDDLESLVSRFPSEYQGAFIDTLIELAREGPPAGLFLVLALKKVTSSTSMLASLCESRLILRMPSRADHLLAGGSTPGWSESIAAGEGEWKGGRVKVAQAQAQAQAQAALADQAELIPPAALLNPTALTNPTALADPTEQTIAGVLAAGWHTAIVVSSRPAETMHRLLHQLPRIGPLIDLSATAGTPSVGDLLTGGDIEVVDARAPTIVVADADTWQRHFSLFAALKAHSPVFFDRCSLQEFRSISGRRELPPPIDSRQQKMWMLTPDGAVQRVNGPGERP